MGLPRRTIAAIVLAAVGYPGIAPAQQGAPEVGAAATQGGTGAGMNRPGGSVILFIDPERLFAESTWGRRALAEVEALSDDLATENRRIEARLTAEEQALTDRRPEMEIDAFRAAARDFDARVRAIRAEQDAKVRDVTRMDAAARQTFFRAATGPLRGLAARLGAAAIMDRRAVFLTVGDVDMTDAAIAEVDAVLGDGPSEDAGSGPLQGPASPGPGAGLSPGPGAVPADGSGTAPPVSFRETPAPALGMPQMTPNAGAQGGLDSDSGAAGAAPAPPPAVAPPEG